MELLLGLRTLREVCNERPLSATNRVPHIIDQLLTTGGRLETDAFQMSFSGNPDELGQWRGYAADGMGCAVVTKASVVSRYSDVAGWVIYDEAKQRRFARRVLNRVRNESDVSTIERAVVAAASYIKHDGFRPEHEFRLLKFATAEEVQFRESGNRLVPFVDYLAPDRRLPLDRIIIGPGWQLATLEPSELARNHVVQGIDRLLRARGLHGTRIESSRIPYDPR